VDNKSDASRSPRILIGLLLTVLPFAIALRNVLTKGRLYDTTQGKRTDINEGQPEQEERHAPPHGANPHSIKDTQRRREQDLAEAKKSKTGKKTLQIALLMATATTSIVAVGQCKLLREQIHNGQRAYLVVVGLELLQEGQPRINVETIGQGRVHAGFRVKNTGQTPATNITYIADIQPNLIVPITLDGMTGRTAIQIQDLGAGQETNEPQLVWLKSPGSYLTEEERARLRDRSAKIYFRVRITYNTVFGQTGVTDVCAHNDWHRETYDERFVSCGSDIR
jgi:hypothetical protein